jgi:outer membrane protein OmpA-like peptidoglycan-associated protein
MESYEDCHLADMSVDKYFCCSLPMIMRVKRIFFLLFVLFTALYVKGQERDKAWKHYNAALLCKARHEDKKACQLLEKAIHEKPSLADAYSQLGEWYFELHQFSSAALVFHDAFTNCPHSERRFAKAYTKCLIYSGDASKALQIIAQYGNKKDKEWIAMEGQASFVKRSMENSSTDTPVNLGIRINSSDPELFPSLSLDSQAMYFTRRVNNMDEDLFFATTDSCGGWFYARNIGAPPNSPSQEAGQAISADGHYLFFNRCENRSSDGWAEGGCDLYMAYRPSVDSDWTVAEPFGVTINTQAYEGMPSLSPDNKDLYFVSDRAGGYGGYDIWISHFENGLWQLPVNAGPAINTSANETAPYISLDNKTLYFTSDGHPGFGGTDLFVSRKINDSMWEAPVNLGYPINTPADEKSQCVTADARNLYFASDRDSAAGNYDIYEVALPTHLQPSQVGFIQGYVYDSLTRAFLNYSSLFVTDAATGALLNQFHSNRGDGSFTLILAANKKYAIHIESSGYTPVDDTLFVEAPKLMVDTPDTSQWIDTSMPPKRHFQPPVRHNVVMLPANYLKPIADTLVMVLHFDAYRVALTDSDKQQISAAMQSWLVEPGVVFSVNSYTDATGSPMVNEDLSTQRAIAVSKELQGLGVDEGAIKATGWGETNNVAPNDTPENKNKNRRVEIYVRR